jgi:hypothetical protein
MLRVTRCGVRGVVWHWRVHKYLISPISVWSVARAYYLLKKQNTHFVFETFRFRLLDASIQHRASFAARAHEHDVTMIGALL